MIDCAEDARGVVKDDRHKVDAVKDREMKLNMGKIS